MRAAEAMLVRPYSLPPTGRSTVGRSGKEALNFAVVLRRREPPDARFEPRIGGVRAGAVGAVRTIRAVRAIGAVPGRWGRRRRVARRGTPVHPDAAKARSRLRRFATIKSLPH